MSDQMPLIGDDGHLEPNAIADAGHVYPLTADTDQDLAFRLLARPDLVTPDATGRTNAAAQFRRTDPDTSRLAAAAVDDLPERYAAILSILEIDGPLSHEAIIDIHRTLRDSLGWKPQSDSSIRTRVRELVDAGLVGPAGSTTTASGRSCLTWGLVAHPSAAAS